MELTTVADDEAVVHDGLTARSYHDLTPDTVHEIDGFTFRTLERPEGELLCRFATVNDVHFGEIEAGLIEGMEMGPTFSAEEGDEPYPDMMSRGAITEMQKVDLAAVIVKGDLTSRGTVEEYDQFRACYEPAFGDRLHVVRGNHDSYYGGTFASDAPFSVELPGVVVAVIDTSIQHHAAGQVGGGTLTWLRDLATGLQARGDGRPVLVFGHHHVWNPESEQRPDNYFGVNPDDSEALVALVAAHPNIRGYFAGHTHRNRVRRFTATRDVPWVEVASVKEFPGVWAEYRVYETGILQIVRRISSHECLQWTEKTRHMYAGMYFDYAFGELADRCFHHHELIMRSPGIFEEHNFRWPEQPGNPKIENKLPWFWFTDVGEARTYLTLWWVWQGLATVGFINLLLNLFVTKNSFGLILWPAAIIAQAVFMRVWVPICRRVEPDIGWWHLFAAGWNNKRSRHCLLLAWNHIEDAQSKDAQSKDVQSKQVRSR